jgi:phosphohistidine phosphatase
MANLEGIASSPYVRTVQTAEILAQAFRVTEVVIRPELTPGRSAAELYELIASVRPGWALVGHNPSLAASAAMVLGLEAFPTKFRKGGVLALERKDAAFLVRWFAAPGRRMKSTL